MQTKQQKRRVRRTAFDLARSAIEEMGRAPGCGPASTKRIAFGLGTSPEWVRRLINGRGPLHTAMSYLVRMVGTDRSPIPVIEAAYSRVLLELITGLTEAQLRDRLHHAVLEETVAEGHANTALHEWLTSDRELDDLRAFISDMVPHLRATLEVVFVAQALERRMSA